MRNFMFKSVFLSAAVACSVLTSLVVSQPGGGNALADAALLKQVQSSDAQIKKGQELFKKNNCNSCHGDNGKGDGLAAAALNPKPRNFHANANWKNGTTFSGLYKTLEEGIAGGPMSSFAHVPAADRVAIIHYIRSLNKGIYPDVSDAEVNKLEQQYGLAKALASGGKSKVIPVALAMEKLVAEAATERQKVERVLNLVRQSGEPGAVLFRTVSYDPERALTMLSHAPHWKSSLQVFSGIVMSEASHNGFHTRVGSFSQQKWQMLFDYLKKIL
jgi:mono/diheme cytochrome c family protein